VYLNALIGERPAQASKELLPVIQTKNADLFSDHMHTNRDVLGDQTFAALGVHYAVASELE
jgi:hypothetical protein